jgi:hypothetical protein
VHPGCELSTHYFSCSGGTGTDLTKSLSGHIMPNLCFYIRWDLWVMSCILVRLGHETSTHYFSYSGGTGKDSTKIVSGHIMLNFYFYIRWDLQLM